MSNADLAFWRDVSVLVLAVQAFVILVVIAAIGYLMLTGLRRSHSWLRRQFPKWQALSLLARDMTERYSAKVAAPVISLAALASSMAAFARLLSSPFRRS